MNKHERELRELWTAAGVTPTRQDALIAECIAKAQPGAKVGPFTIGGCTHNEMVPNDSTTHAWKCATCGHVYGAPNTIEYRGYRVTYESNRFQRIARIYQHSELVGCAADLDDAKRTIDMTIEAGV